MKLDCQWGNILSKGKKVVWIYIWWPLHSDHLFMEKRQQRMILSHLFTHQIWKQYQQPQSKVIARNFKKLYGKKLLQRHWLKPKKNWNCKVLHHNAVEFFVFVIPNSPIVSSKVYTRRITDETVIMQSCFLDVLHQSLSQK